MQPCVAAPAFKGQLEDALEHLPFSTVVDYPKGGTIYNQDQLSTGLYLVMEGRVKVSRLINTGHQLVIDIYKADDFFGESAILNTHRPEQATALADTKLMTWNTAALKEIVLRRPRLGVALLQILTQRNNSFKQRIESFATDTIARRLARSLIRFAERLGSGPGTANERGMVRVVALTHELISQYVGTSREIVTYYMNQFRREGYVEYSRKGIVLHPETLRQWMRENA